jgi:hypothetical protein
MKELPLRAKSGHSATVREQVWMVPADQGLFFGGALIVGAAMSSAFFCGEWRHLSGHCGDSVARVPQSWPL